ncbi:MAG TPA: tRNA lysidine(34) synthetase TilS [Polyangiaceae bacterium]|nr:tRNA lysidine(34) synthetase TilS [Polyangiaceae bacterium]
MRSHPPTLLTLARRLVREHGLVGRGETVLVAVSGGPDSMALLHVLARLRGELGCGLVAHGVDHGLRPEAGAELERASAFAASLGVPFGQSSVAVEPGGDLQARARRARQAALRRAAAEAGAARIATGHHADDRAETVLLRLLRGSGPRGLACLPPRAGEFIRPLLLARRADVEAHLTRHNVPFSLDASNGDRRFLRARVRHELMPLLLDLSPGVVGHLTGLADDLMAEGECPTEGLRRAHRQAVWRASRLGKRGVWLRLSGGREVFAEAPAVAPPTRKAPGPLRDGRPGPGGVANWPNSGQA